MISVSDARSGDQPDKIWSLDFKPKKGDFVTTHLSQKDFFFFFFGYIVEIIVGYDWDIDYKFD